MNLVINNIYVELVLKVVICFKIDSVACIENSMLIADPTKANK